MYLRQITSMSLRTTHATNQRSVLQWMHRLQSAIEMWTALQWRSLPTIVIIIILVDPFVAPIYMAVSWVWMPVSLGDHWRFTSSASCPARSVIIYVSSSRKGTAQNWSCHLFFAPDRSSSNRTDCIFEFLLTMLEQLKTTAVWHTAGLSENSKTVEPDE